MCLQWKECIEKIIIFIIILSNSSSSSLDKTNSLEIAINCYNWQLIFLRCQVGVFGPTFVMSIFTSVIKLQLFEQQLVADFSSDVTFEKERGGFHR